MFAGLSVCMFTCSFVLLSWDRFAPKYQGVHFRDLGVPLIFLIINRAKLNLGAMKAKVKQNMQSGVSIEYFCGFRYGLEKRISTRVCVVRVGEVDTLS